MTFEGFPHLLYSSVCDHVLPVQGQATCLGLAVSFPHKILPVLTALTPAFTFSPVNLEAEDGGRDHLLPLQRSAGVRLQSSALQRRLCPGRLHQTTGRFGLFQTKLVSLA